MTASATESSPPDERSGRERILHAAIAAFADRGVASTSLKEIAERAEVSQALIVHHFGSKDALREACDAYVAAKIREQKLTNVRERASFDPIGKLRDVDELRPLLRYLARTLGDGHPSVAAVVDEMIEDAIVYMAEGEEAGLVKPTPYPRERAVLLVLMGLGQLTLHEHVERHLGADLLGPTAGLKSYLLPMVELFTNGVLPDGAHDELHGAFDRLPRE